VISVLAVTFLSGLATTSRATIIADEQATAEGLARSQMEWARGAEYVYEATGYTPAPLPGGADYGDYSVVISTVPLHNPDDGIQKITVLIERSGDGLFELEGYKMDR